MTSPEYFGEVIRSDYELVAHVGQLHRAVDLFVQLQDDRARRSRRRDVAEPAARFVAVNRLRRRRRVGPERNARPVRDRKQAQAARADMRREAGDRKSTRLNSSHVSISYA